MEYNEHTPIPMRRYLAKFIDISIWMSIFTFAINSLRKIDLFPDSIDYPVNITYYFTLFFSEDKRGSNIFSDLSFLIPSIIFYYLLFILIFAADAWVISTFKTSIGKRALNIWVTDYEGKNLSFKVSFKRNRKLLHKGCGFYIPLYNIYRLTKSYRLLKINPYKNGQTRWDKSTNSIINNTPVPTIQFILVIVFFTTAFYFI